MIGIISVTKKGDVLAKELQKYLDVNLYLKTQIEDFKLYELTKEAMEKNKGIVFNKLTNTFSEATTESIQICVSIPVGEVEINL